MKGHPLVLLPYINSISEAKKGNLKIPDLLYKFELIKIVDIMFFRRRITTF